MQECENREEEVGEVKEEKNEDADERFRSLLCVMEQERDRETPEGLVVILKNQVEDA